MNTLTSEIRAELARKGITQGALAKQIGISEYSLSKKINGKAQFKLEEAQKITEFHRMGERDMRTIYQDRIFNELIIDDLKEVEK